MPAKSTRSPNAPSRSLSACFANADKLFRAFPNASFGETQIASVLDFSSAGGAFKGLLSDLKQYGLIEKSGTGEFAVSQSVKDYPIASPDDAALIRYDLALRPKMFAQIVEQQGYHLPENDTLAGVLVARFGFNNEKAAKTAKALRDSLEWAGALDQKGNVVKPSNGCGSKVDSGVGVDNEASEPECTTVNTSVNPRSHSARAEGILVADVPVSNTQVVHIEYPRELTSADADKVATVLKALAN